MNSRALFDFNVELNNVTSEYADGFEFDKYNEDLDEEE